MNPIQSYSSVDLVWPFILRGTAVQSGTLDRVGVLLASSAGTEGFAVSAFNLQNRSGGTVFAGLGVRIPNKYWIAGQWTDAAGTPFVDDTTDAQNRTTNDFPLETLVANDGYVVASRVPFNAVGIDVGTASVGAGVVRAWRHTNEAGSGWVGSTVAETVVTTAVGAAAGTNYAIGENVVVVMPMVDWGQTQDTGLSGIPAGYYALNIRATTAPTTAGVANALELYRIYFIVGNVTDNAQYERELSPSEFYMPYGDMLIPFFSVANLGNKVSVLARTAAR